jgi:uncharacterized protein
MSQRSMHERTPPESRGLHPYFALACAITWLAATPLVSAWIRGTEPPGYAVALAGLSAFGPLLAAAVVAGRQGRLREVFGRWRTRAIWVVVALAAPVVIRTIAVAIDALLGGAPSQWFYPPTTPEQIAALVVFPLGEEFGWRGFAHPRAVARQGLVKGSLLVGVVWGLWHLVYSITPAAGGFDMFVIAQNLIELPLYSLILAWIFERSGRSMAVAIAFHAGAHLDHLELAPRSELDLHAVHVGVVAVLAFLAARALSRMAAPTESR